MNHPLSTVDKRAKIVFCKRFATFYELLPEMSPAERAVPHQPSAIPFHTILSLDPIIDGTNARENNIKTATLLHLKESGFQCLITVFTGSTVPLPRCTYATFRDRKRVRLVGIFHGRGIVVQSSSKPTSTPLPFR